MVSFNEIGLVYDGLKYKNMIFSTSAPITTGVDGLDSLLDNGVEPLKVYMFFGPAGSGKTIILHQIAVCAVKQRGNAVYLDTELSFNPDIVRKMAERFDVSDALNKIYYKRIKYPSEFDIVLKKLVERRDVGVVLLDNFDQFIRMYQGTLAPSPGVLYALTRQVLIRLHHIKELLRIPVVITNRVYSNLDELITDSYIPYGGIAIKTMVNRVIHLMREDNKVFRAVDIYSNKPSFMFTIKNDGVYDL